MRRTMNLAREREWRGWGNGSLAQGRISRGKRPNAHSERRFLAPSARGDGNFPWQVPESPLLRDEAIPHPAHRLDEGSMLAEFLAQREDMHVDRSAAAREVPSPHVL